MQFQYGYEADRVTSLKAEVCSISCSVYKSGDGMWEYLVAIGYGRDQHRRERGVRETRIQAIQAIAVHLLDHFECVPGLATLRIERGREQSLADYLSRYPKRFVGFSRCRE